jgi:hypothetical protein
MIRRVCLACLSLVFVVAAARAEKPVTPAELENYGAHLALLLSSGRLEPLRGLLDEPAMVKAILAEVELPDRARQAIEAQLGAAIWTTVQQAISGGADDPIATYFLRAGRDERGDYLLLRQWDWTTLDYLRVRIHRDDTGKLRIGDVHAMSIGEPATAMLGRYFRLGTEQAKAGDEPGRQAMRQVIRIAQLAEAGDVEGLVAAYEIADEKVKADRLLALAYLQAKVATSDDEADVLPALDAYFKRFPDDAAAAVVAWPVYSQARRADDARRQIDLIDRFAGGDPWLDQVRSGIALEAGDLPEARRLAEKAVQVIDNEEALVNLLHVTMRQRDHDRSLAVLTRLVKEHDDAESEDYVDESDWEAFKSSPQHARYRALLPATQPTE